MSTLLALLNLPWPQLLELGLLALLILWTLSTMALALGAVIYFRVLDPIAQKTNILAWFFIPIAALIWLFDVAYNVVFGLLLFFQFPFKYDPLRKRRALTFSDRLQHILTASRYCQTWRASLAAPIARLTNWLTEPNHIRGV